MDRAEPEACVLPRRRRRRRRCRRRRRLARVSFVLALAESEYHQHSVFHVFHNYLLFAVGR